MEQSVFSYFMYFLYNIESLWTLWLGNLKPNQRIALAALLALSED